MKLKYFVLILLLVAIIVGSSSFFVAKNCLCSSQGQTNEFKTEAAKFANMLENKNVSRDEILSQAQKVFSMRRDNIIAACRKALKTERKSILALLPCPADSNKMDSCCVGPDCCCKFDSTQSQQISKADPNFLSTSSELRSKMDFIRNSLASMLNDISADESKIISGIEDYLNVDTALEIRAVEYFLTIKPQLTPDQQRQILCSCTSQLRNQTCSD